jgi:hypothetical protein
MKSATLTAVLNKFIPTKSGPDAEYDDAAMHMALTDPEIRGAAIRCALAVGILVDKTALEGFLRLSLEQANADGGVSPVLFLQQQLVALQREIAAADTRAALHKARWQVRSDALMPLMIAAGAFSAAISAEREMLFGRIAIASQSRHLSNVSGMQRGLTHAEMEKLGLLEPSPATVAGWRERVKVIDAQLIQLAAFGADPLKSTTHLAGLPIPGLSFPAACDADAGSAAKS